MMWIAGISVTLLSLVGIAAMTGVLPTRTAPAPQEPAITAVAPVGEPAVPPAAPTVVPEPPIAAVPPAPTIASKPATASQAKTVKPKYEQGIPPNPPAVGAVPPDYVPPPARVSAPPRCVDCGVIDNVRQVTHEGQGTGAGAVIGGLAGGVLGSNIGKGNTRTVASIAGAVGGGLLGNSIEKSQRTTVAYQVVVRMNDGTTRQIESQSLPPWRTGDKVKLVGGSIVLR
jgi:outer membrane lipoprotein SlyB